MSLFQEAIRDEHGLVDVAYLSLYWLMAHVLGAIVFVCVLALWAFWRNDTFDPQALGIAIGAICGGFATALGALAAYMLATRKPKVE